MKLELDNLLYFPTRTEWRRWLETNHDKAREVWFIHYKRGTGMPTVSYNDAVEEALCFGWIDAQMKSIDEKRFANRFAPRTSRSRWSQTNKAKAEKLIEEGKMNAAGLAKIEEAKRSGAWANAYATRTTEDVPANLQLALSENEEALNNFQRFPVSYRNACSRYVNDARTAPTRQKRIAEIVMRAALNKKLGDNLAPE